MGDTVDVTIECLDTGGGDVLKALALALGARSPQVSPQVDFVAAPTNALDVATLQAFGNCQAAWLADRGTTESGGYLTHWTDCASGRAIDAVPNANGWTVDADGWNSATPRPQIVADGAHYLTVSDATLLDLFDGDDQPLHVFAWWNPIDTSTTRALCCLSTPGTAGAFTPFLRVNGTTLRTDRLGNTGGSLNVTATGAQTSGRQNWVSTFDGTLGSLYKNGSLVGGPGNQSTANALAISALTIGAFRAASTSYYLTGGLGAILVYSSLTDLPGLLAFVNALYPVD